MSCKFPNCSRHAEKDGYCVGHGRIMKNTAQNVSNDSKTADKTNDGQTPAKTEMPEKRLKTANKAKEPKRKVSTQRRPIKKKSKKLASEERKYNRERKAFLVQHPRCEYSGGCNQVATEVHHPAGRGKNLRNWKIAKALCHTHHRVVTDNSKAAIENGDSLPRVATPYKREK